MTAEIITIGDEILIGQIIDTNSAWIAQQLNNIGVKVIQITSIQDDRDHIIEALTNARNRARFVLITGGLGPTNDDITKETLADYFQSDYVFNEEVFENIKRLFEPRKIPILDSNKQQALVPNNCEVLLNKFGTAPGMWFEEEDAIFISMPGVPYEMKEILLNGVIPKIKEKFELPTIIHRTVLTQGLGEAKLAEVISDWQKSLDLYDIKLAFLPSLGRVRLRLSAIGNYQTKKVVDDKIIELQQIIPDLIYGYDNETLEEIVGNLLKKKNQTIATAESCTGGNIAGKLTRVSGSSDYFKGSIVAYSNEMKHNFLNVSTKELDEYGAVSKPVVEQMAKGIKEKFNTDFAIATSGIAGPTGGSPQKPVGTIWIAISSPNRLISKMFRFGDDRERNVERTIITALNLLRKEIIAQDL